MGDIGDMFDNLAGMGGLDRENKFIAAEYDISQKVELTKLFKVLMAGPTYNDWMEYHTLEFQRTLGVELGPIHKHILSFCLDAPFVEEDDTFSRYTGNTSILLSGKIPIAIGIKGTIYFCAPQPDASGLDVALVIHTIISGLERYLPYINDTPEVVDVSSYVLYDSSLATAMYAYALTGTRVKAGFTKEIKEIVDFELSMDGKTPWSWT